MNDIFDLINSLQGLAEQLDLGDIDPRYLHFTDSGIEVAKHLGNAAFEYVRNEKANTVTIAYDDDMFTHTFDLNNQKNWDDAERELWDLADEIIGIVGWTPLR